MATQRDNGSTAPAVLNGPRRSRLRRFWGWTAIGEKSGFDFAQLLVVPFAVAGLGLWFQMTINASSRASDTDRAREGALQAYLDGMTSLIIDGRLGLEEEQPGVGVLAKVHTVTVLSTLNRDRKHVVLRFLREHPRLVALPPVQRPVFSIQFRRGKTLNSNGITNSQKGLFRYGYSARQWLHRTCGPKWPAAKSLA